MNKRIRNLSLAFVLTALLTGCDRGAETPKQPTPPPASESVAAPVDDILVTVNSVPITRTTLMLHLSAQARSGKQLTADQALNELVDMALLAREATLLGLEREPAIRAEIERHRTMVLANNMLRRQVASTEPTEEELRREYATRTALLPEREYRLRHILVAEKGTAEELAAKLKKGADFAVLARESSKDQSAEQDGDLGWLPRERLIPPIADAVATLEDGKYSAEPIESSFGWHLIKREESREVVKPAYEEARESLARLVPLQRSQEYLKRLRDSASIEVNEPLESPATK